MSEAGNRAATAWEKSALSLPTGDHARVSALRHYPAVADVRAPGANAEIEIVTHAGSTRVNSNTVRQRQSIWARADRQCSTNARRSHSRIRVGQLPGTGR